jgi:hypothetical protein
MRAGYPSHGFYFESDPPQAPALPSSAVMRPFLTGACLGGALPLVWSPNPAGFDGSQRPQRPQPLP